MMSERKWTPGPWISYDGIVRIVDGSLVSLVYSNGVGSLNANAHLIAAAPDLAVIAELVALLPIRDHLPDDVPVTGVDGAYITQGDVLRARAAMSKARGETK